jgi:hypothetical protein
MASIAYQKGEDVGSAFTESSVLFMSMMHLATEHFLHRITRRQHTGITVNRAASSIFDNACKNE